MFVVTIQTQNNESINYTDLPGPIEIARNVAIEQFRREHPGSELADSFVMPEADYYGAHDCHDPKDRGCCDICGGVMPRSWLDRQINGSD